MFLSSKEITKLNFKFYKLDMMAKRCNKKQDLLLFAIAETDLDKFIQTAENIGCQVDGFQNTDNDGEIIISIIYK